MSRYLVKTKTVTEHVIVTEVPPSELDDESLFEHCDVDNETSFNIEVLSSEEFEDTRPIHYCSYCSHPVLLEPPVPGNPAVGQCRNADCDICGARLKADGEIYLLLLQPREDSSFYTHMRECNLTEDKYLEIIENSVFYPEEYKSE